MHSPSSAPAPASLSLEDIRDVWPVLANVERQHAFQLLSRVDAEAFFLSLSARDQAALLVHLPSDQRRLWIRLLPPDDAADLVQAAPASEHDGLLTLLDEATRQEVTALLAYAEDAAGGLMSPRFVRARPDMTADEAIAYVRKQARERVATMHYVYVLDADQHLLGAISFRELFASDGTTKVSDVMHRDVARLDANTNQEAVTRIFAQRDLHAMPVIDQQGRMIGVVTVDDLIDVVREAATEDIQKMGGGEALGGPYLATGFGPMVKKRAGWLSALFLGEMLTATAMGHFEDKIAKAVVLALFVPLIISSGGNSGSQATTIVIRAMALGEVRLRDWWRVARREVLAGLALGAVLGIIGLARIAAWELLFHTYGSHWLVIALTVSTSLVGVVTFGTLAGSMLPFILRRLGFDPASASAPFVATLVDVTGLVIYFSVASLFLRGAML